MKLKHLIDDCEYKELTRGTGNDLNPIVKRHLMELEEKVETKMNEIVDAVNFILISLGGDYDKIKEFKI